MSSRSEDLTADLLHDLAADPAAADPVPAPARSEPEAESAPSAFVETRLFLAPNTWLRPRVARTAASFSVSAGPVQLRFGRRPS